MLSGKKEPKDTENLVSALMESCDCFMNNKDTCEFLYTPMLKGKALENIGSPEIREVGCFGKVGGG